MLSYYLAIIVPTFTEFLLRFGFYVENIFKVCNIPLKSGNFIVYKKSQVYILPYIFIPLLFNTK